MLQNIFKVVKIFTKRLTTNLTKFAKRMKKLIKFSENLRKQ